MIAPNSRPLLRLLDFAPVALFAAVVLVFGLLSDKFLTVANFTQILVQSSSTAVVAVGMTYVLLTAGVDLSVGAIMFVGAGIAGVICGAYLAKGGLRVAIFEKNDRVGGRMKIDKTSPGFTGFEHWVAFGQGWGGGAWYQASRELDADVRFFEVPEPCLYFRGSGRKFRIAPRCASPSALVSYYESLYPTPLSEETRRESVRVYDLLELQDLGRRAGLSIAEVYGGFDFAAFHPDESP